MILILYMGGFDGASERNRTSDLLITNQLLYRLSYAGFDGSEKSIPKVDESPSPVKNEWGHAPTVRIPWATCGYLSSKRTVTVKVTGRGRPLTTIGS